MSKAIHAYSQALLNAVSTRMYGVEDVTRLSLIALYTGGHILLEGNPGMGKTELVKSLGSVLRFPFGRIQFTPDLMPADITGTYMPDPQSGGGKLSFKPGPVFTTLLLADEINRATPKTQSAMLEAMAEKQVTVLGEVRKLEEPFMVLATQNPIDQEGTYNLPEAQADRFMFKVLMPSPDAETLRLILSKTTGAMANPVAPKEAPANNLLPTDRDDSLRKFQELQKRIQATKPLPSLEAHLLNLFLATNHRFDELQGLPKKSVSRLRELVGSTITYGLGPRASIAMMLGAKADALLFTQSDYAEGPSLGRIAIPALRHRLKLELDWDETYSAMIRQKDYDENGLFEKLLSDLIIHSAPEDAGYRDTVRSASPLSTYAAGENWS